MSEEQFNEAKRLLQGGMKLRPAARRVGVSHVTLWRRLQKESTQRLADSKVATESGSNSETDSEFEPEPWRTIRRNENETRKRDGLPPLTEDQWNAEKKHMEECQKSTEQALDGWQTFPTWKPT